MVEDDVQDDLDAAVVALFDERFELVYDVRPGTAGRGRRTVARHWRKEAHSRVPPVVVAVLICPWDDLAAKQEGPLDCLHEGCNECVLEFTTIACL